MYKFQRNKFSNEAKITISAIMFFIDLEYDIQVVYIDAHNQLSNQKFTLESYTSSILPPSALSRNRSIIGSRSEFSLVVATPALHYQNLKNIKIDYI